MRIFDIAAATNEELKNKIEVVFLSLKDPRNSQKREDYEVLTALVEAAMARDDAGLQEMARNVAELAWDAVKDIPGLVSEGHNVNTDSRPANG